MNNKIRVVIVDDHRHFRVGIRTELEADDSVCVVGEGRCGEQVKQLVATCKPDVLMLDLRMDQYLDPDRDEDFSALPTIFQLHKQYPDLIIVIVSGYINLTIIEDAFTKGVRGYILKDEAEEMQMNRVVKSVYSGRLVISQTIQILLVDAASGVSHRPKLTDRQVTIMLTIAANLNASDEVHAKTLGISTSGLRNQLSKIYAIMNVQTKTSCVVECMRYGIIPFEPLFDS